MVVLAETQRALSDVMANSLYGFGQHTHGRVRTGQEGINLGVVAFDPTKHSPFDIDPLSPMSAALGVDHVRQTLPSKPLHVNLVADQFPRNEHPVIRDAKNRLTYNLNREIEAALPGVTDAASSYVVGTIESDSPFVRSGRELAVEPETAEEAIAQLSIEGLTFVISDFQRLRLRGLRHFDGLIAIKINHPAERYIPAGVGFVSLGGELEVNRSNAEQLERVNNHLQARHDATVAELEAAGATVVPVVADMKRPLAFFNSKTTDNALADAIRTTTR